MQNIQKSLNQFVKIYSMDYQSEQSIKTLFNVLSNASENFDKNTLIKTFKLIPEMAYKALVDYMKSNSFFEEYWLFEIYRNSPTYSKEDVAVEEFTAEDLSFIK